MIGIYKITCTSNNKVYIGSSSNIKNRWYSHKSKLRRGEHNPNLLSSYKKYGMESFCFDIIEECNVEDLIKREIFWADFYKKQGVELFNCGIFLDNPTRGVPLTNEHKIKMGLKLKGIEPHNKNKKAPDWVRAKISERQKEIGRKPTAENIEKLRAIAKLPKSEEHKKNLSDSRKIAYGIKIKCLDTGERFISLIDASIKYGVTYQAIRQSIKQNTRCKKLKFVYDN
jgi:group I intron endonuclease